ncbi:DNA alkylation response protein [Zobellella denitrificans]|uniref:acyl-CoA dehydrogenase family protein n=1 Tax=Zobellella denitrificans TaxID=347534 RepID=UPI000B8BDF17|nr:acyl-CoA dehydrogenase family protein [Zobellella denitrificans]OXS14293.1 DNA alkylation response protein [Zobellella denitrificans]
MDNQTPDFVDQDAFTLDQALVEGVMREGAAWARPGLEQYGRWITRPDIIAAGFAANRWPPVLHGLDRQGRRQDRVSYHPAYHQLMRHALEAGLHAAPWREPGTGAQVARAARYYLHSQVEAGHCCPLTMTFAAVPVLQRYRPDWLGKVLALAYDGDDKPPERKPGLTLGMAMTERQGGSDLRANTSRAEPQRDGSYLLRGHKWFMSAPMSDAFLMLAQAPAGLGCFLVPRWWQGGRNGLELQRLKDKMGNRSNASAEVALAGAKGWLLGEEGRGVPTIIEMVALTRFDCILGSAAGQRQAVVQAVHHARHRKAFGERLIRQPLMRRVLADLQLEVEGSLALGLRLARALDDSTVPGEAALVRLGTAIGKYWVCKRTPQHAAEAMECLGGNGAMEDFITARLYREAPINAIWEGSGNIQALDVLRVLDNNPDALAALRGELTPALAAFPRLGRAWRALEPLLKHPAPELARHVTERLALLWQGAILARGAPEGVARAFIDSRLGEGGLTFGTLAPGCDVELLLQRALAGD